MKINRSGPADNANQIVRSTPQPASQTKPDARRTAARGSTSDRHDSVQLSESGLAKAAEQQPDVSPDRLREIRQRILSGAYDTVEVLGKVAGSILGRGDV